MEQDGREHSQQRAIEQASLARTRALITRRREAADRKKAVIPTVVIGGLVAIAFALTALFGDDTPAAAKHTSSASPPQACAADDSACLGGKIIAAIQAPCSTAIEAQLRFPPTWNDSMWERRFSNPAWYQPPHTLIFYGRQATLTNAIGMEIQPHYFCVATVGGAVVKAGIPDLP